MLLLEAISRIDKSEIKKTDVSVSELRTYFDLYYDHEEPDDFESRVAEYYLTTWYCTDAWVGASVIFFDDEPVLFVQQTGRKMDRIFECISRDAAIRLREYLVNKKWEPSCMADLTEEIGDCYSVRYESQLIRSFHKSGFYNGKPATIVFDVYPFTEQRKLGDQKIKIICEDETLTIDVKDFKIPYSIV